MSDMAASIFSNLNTKFTNDTGSGGLNESGGSAQVRHFVRVGDTNYANDRTFNWPMIAVEIHVAESRVFGERRCEALVRMHLYTNRDANTSSFTIQTTVGSRIIVLFDGQSISSDYSIVNLLRSFQGPASDNELHMVYEFNVNPRVPAGV